MVAECLSFVFFRTHLGVGTNASEGLNDHPFVIERRSRSFQNVQKDLLEKHLEAEVGERKEEDKLQIAHPIIQTRKL